MEPEYIRKITEVEQRAKSNTRRIEKLELTTTALNELTAAVREMVVKQDYATDKIKKLDSKIDGIDSRIDTLEQKPGKRWDKTVEGLILAALTIIVSYIAIRIGIK